MITVKEIAQICNVSTSTVSNILNGKSNVGEDTRQRVLKVVKETGYRPNYFAQSMRKQTNRMIAVITEDLNEFSTIPIVEAVMAYCDDYRYRTILVNLRMYDKWKDTWYNDDAKLRKEVEPVIREMLSVRVDAIIYVAGHCRLIDCVPDEFDIPIVFAYGMSKNKKYPSVIIDDEKGGYDMTKYLLDKGHRKIGVIAGVMDNFHTMSRLQGYRKALEERDIPFQPELLYYGDWKRASGYQIAKKLMKQDITAAFCMNDNMAAGVYDYMYENDLVVGKDIAIVGYDNKEIAEYLRPRLSTNEIPLRKIGKKAAEIAIYTLLNPNVEKYPSMIEVPCKVIERESVILYRRN